DLPPCIRCISYFVFALVETWKLSAKRRWIKFIQTIMRHFVIEKCTKCTK
ncbi:unnamed protein product, partial [Heterotrigona itama]